MKSIAAHCKNCGQAVTCKGADDATTLSGRCDKCGMIAQVVPYTPLPFSGHPVDPRAPLMAAHVGPFGSVPVQNFRPQASGGAVSSPSHTPGIGGFATEGPAETAPAQTAEPEQAGETVQTNANLAPSQMPQAETPQAQSVNTQPVQDQPVTDEAP